MSSSLVRTTKRLLQQSFCPDSESDLWIQDPAVQTDRKTVTSQEGEVRMVEVAAPRVNTDTKIVFSTLDQSKQEYLSQFSDKVKLEEAKAVQAENDHQREQFRL